MSYQPITSVTTTVVGPQKYETLYTELVYAGRLTTAQMVDRRLGRFARNY